MKYIRDPLHGDIEVPEEFLPIVDHPLFQRLRRISQLALVRYIYPSANHTRFEHSLGVFHVTRHATDNPSVWAYALLHDVGHPPFSHLMETALNRLGYRIDHERMGRKLAGEILTDTVFSVKEVFKNEENPLVHGGVGSDRIDYIIRDSYFTGVRIGYLQWDRLVRNMYVDGGRLVIRNKVLANAEHLFVARFILGDAVYYHKTLLVLDEMFVRAVSELLDHYGAEDIMVMDEPAVISAFRGVGSVWWRRIEDRRIFKVVFRGDEGEARDLYERLAGQYGEETVILGKRPTFYSKPDVYLEDGRTLIQASPLIRSLRRSEEERVHWFVAIDPEKVPRSNYHEL